MRWSEKTSPPKRRKVTAGGVAKATRVHTGNAGAVAQAPDDLADTLGRERMATEAGE